MKLKIFHVSKSGGTAAVMNALIKSGIYTRKMFPVEPGCIAVPLTVNEVAKLKKNGCVVTEAIDKQPLPQLIPMSIQAI
ncbi:MAG: hypothetical protein NTX82_01360 [Candidatus Parcubacteria bacterium]|nr:hypothetical protein [Candidatus Parcubacteria bacterium]